MPKNGRGKIFREISGGRIPGTVSRIDARPSPNRAQTRRVWIRSWQRFQGQRACANRQPLKTNLHGQLAGASKEMPDDVRTSPDCQRSRVARSEQLRRTAAANDPDTAGRIGRTKRHAARARNHNLPAKPNSRQHADENAAKIAPD